MHHNLDVFPRVSIVIVNWNTRALLGACLDSIRATLGKVSYEIIVVDNASTDGSLEWLRATQPDVELIPNRENVGFARANNQALERCRGEFALLLNSDAQLLDKTVGRLLEVMEHDARVAAAAPKLLNADGSFQAGPNDDLTLSGETLLALGLARYFRQGHFPGYGESAASGAYAWVGGTCLLLRRAAWEHIGLLDTNYFMYTEEADWCWRARQAGWTIWYEPGARALHLGGGSSRNAPAQMRAALYKSKLVFFNKHRPRWQAQTLRAVFMLTSFVKIVAYNLAARLHRMRAPLLRERASSFRLVLDAVRTIGA